MFKTFKTRVIRTVKAMTNGNVERKDDKYIIDIPNVITHIVTDNDLINAYYRADMSNLPIANTASRILTDISHKAEIKISEQCSDDLEKTVYALNDECKTKFGNDRYTLLDLYAISDRKYGGDIKIYNGYIYKFEIVFVNDFYIIEKFQRY